MKSLFNSTAEVKAVLPMLHRHYDWEMELKEFTIQAARMYIVTEIGQAQYDAIADDFDAEEPAEQTAHILPDLRRATAYYTYMRLLSANRVHVSSQGVQESQSEDRTSVPANRWAIADAMKDAAMQADLYMDAVLMAMEAKAAADDWYQPWTASAEYQDIYSLMIFDLNALERNVIGASSWRLLQRLRSAIRRVQERDVCGILGQSLYEDLNAKIAARKDTALSDANQKLLAKIQAYLAPAALLEAMPHMQVTYQFGKIFASTFEGPLASGEAEQQARQIANLSTALAAQASGARATLIRFLIQNQAEYPLHTPPADLLGPRPYNRRLRGGVTL
jgi:hypothetical protein